MESLDPKSVWLFFFGFLLRGLFLLIFLSFWVLPFLAAFFAVVSNGSIANEIFSLLGLIIVVFGIYMGFCLIMANLSYKYWKYELTDDSFKKESGVIWKKYVSIPYERIQNVDIYRGVFARMMGLSDLQIQTAGSSAVYSTRGFSGVGAEGRLPALNMHVAEQLRDELIRRSKVSKPNM